jgi:valyl-tRNA synthetase
MLGDEAVAVHPKDKRYKSLLKVWKKLILPILNK